MTRADRCHRNAEICHERMKGMTIRQIAKRYYLSKSQVHRIVWECEILPPNPIPRFELVPSSSGGVKVAITYERTRPRGYKVRNGRRLYSGMA
jgi:hypothetical protein